MLYGICNCVVALKNSPKPLDRLHELYHDRGTSPFMENVLPYRHGGVPVRYTFVPYGRPHGAVPPYRYVLVSTEVRTLRTPYSYVLETDFCYVSV